MIYYLDTSLLVSIIVNDGHTARAAAWFERTEPTSLVSSFAKAEFSAAISRLVRIKHLKTIEGSAALATFDKWLDIDAHLVNLNNDDIQRADRMVRDFDTKLLAPDAIHLAIAKRLSATLVTFDTRLSTAATLQDVENEIPN